MCICHSALSDNIVHTHTQTYTLPYLWGLFIDILHYAAHYSNFTNLALTNQSNSISRKGSLFFCITYRQRVCVSEFIIYASAECHLDHSAISCQNGVVSFALSSLHKLMFSKSTVMMLFQTSRRGRDRRGPSNPMWYCHSLCHKASFYMFWNETCHVSLVWKKQRGSFWRQEWHEDDRNLLLSVSLRSSHIGISSSAFQSFTALQIKCLEDDTF